MYRVEDYPQIKDNFFLKSRNIGASRRLNGDIEIIVCFMKKRNNDFSMTAQAQFKKELYTACDWLKAEAQRYGATLSFKYRFFTVDTPENADPKNGYLLIKDFFNSQNINIDKLQNRYEMMSGSNESPFILVFDEQGRSFADKQPTENIIHNEISVVFRYSDNRFYWSGIAHELLHQFGAIDYYYPRPITEYAEIYFKNSIMGIGMQNTLDDLSAYLVGIKDTISAESYYFLKETMWITYELYCQQISDEWNKSKKQYDESGEISENKSDTQSIKQTSSMKQTADIKKETCTTKQHKFTTILAKQPGIVVTTNVLAGQVVKKGDVLAVTGSGEHTAILATVSGCVDRIFIKPGERVKVGTPVALIAYEG